MKGRLKSERVEHFVDSRKSGVYSHWRYEYLDSEVAEVVAEASVTCCLLLEFLKCYEHFEFCKIVDLDQQHKP